MRTPRSSRARSRTTWIRASRRCSSYGDRSHWLQPWRAYLDTVPAVRLRDSVGIVFNVTDAQADAAARLLAANGVRRARFEVGWNSIDYAKPAKLIGHAEEPPHQAAGAEEVRDPAADPAELQPRRALPNKALTLRTIEPALEDDTRIHLDAATAAAVVPRRTGLNGFQTSGKMADPLITSVDADGWATLSRPLPPRPARRGPQGLAAALRAVPPAAARRTARPSRASRPRWPAGSTTWASWSARPETILGSQAFDVEIWNELGFGSEFLDVDEYYHPNIDTGQGDVTEAIVERTVAWMRNPANGAIGRRGGERLREPALPRGGLDQPARADGDRQAPVPVRRRAALPARRTWTRCARSTRRATWTARFDPLSEEWTELVHAHLRRTSTPSATCGRPRRPPSIDMDHLVRDLSPHTTYIDGVAHGRDTHPPGAAPPEVWITEMNLDPLERVATSASWRATACTCRPRPRSGRWRHT